VPNLERDSVWESLQSLPVRLWQLQLVEWGQKARHQGLVIRPFQTRYYSRRNPSTLKTLKTLKSPNS
jgi:hypothetical protein